MASRSSRAQASRSQDQMQRLLGGMAAFRESKHRARAPNATHRRVHFASPTATYTLLAIVPLSEARHLRPLLMPPDSGNNTEAT